MKIITPYVIIRAHNPDYLINFVNRIIMVNNDIWWEDENTINFYDENS